MENMFYLREEETGKDVLQKLYIEPTSVCNLQCAICFRHGWIEEKTGFMEKEVFQKTMTSIQGMKELREVFFGGMGEPLCHPDICEMISMIPKDLPVSLLTNATLLTKERSRSLIESGLSELWVSMDGFDEKSYEKMHCKSRFDLIRKNLMDFHRSRKGTSVKLGITFVLTPYNLEQLDHINQFADWVEADQMNISHMIPGEPIKKETLLKLYGRKDIPVGRMKRLIRQESKTEEHLCPFVHNHCTFVKWDGEVVPCMQLLHTCYTYLYEEKRRISSVSYGNIRKKGLTEIWNSEEYTAFRKRVYTFYFPYCRVCFGCEDRKENLTDCFLGEAPTCGACLWASGKVFCP